MGLDSLLGDAFSTPFSLTGCLFRLSLCLKLGLAVHARKLDVVVASDCLDTRRARKPVAFRTPTSRKRVQTVAAQTATQFDNIVCSDDVHGVRVVHAVNCLGTRFVSTIGVVQFGFGFKPALGLGLSLRLSTRLCPKFCHFHTHFLAVAMAATTAMIPETQPGAMPVEPVVATLVSSSPASRPYVNVKLRGENVVVSFKVAPSATIFKLANAYCQHTKADPLACRYIFEGRRLKMDETVESIGMGDDDEIDVMISQMGG